MPLMISDIWKCMPNFIVYTIKVLQVLLIDVRLFNEAKHAHQAYPLLHVLYNLLIEVC